VSNKERRFPLSRPGNSIREAMAALAHEELRGAKHPATSQFIAYYRGEIPSAEAAAIREHLSLCDDCSALVLDAAEFFADEDEEEEAAEATTPSDDVEAAWEELRALVSGAKTPPSPPTLILPPPPSIPQRSLVRSLAFAYGVAAVFAALSVGLFLFKGTSPPQQPQVNAGFYDLTSSHSERGEGPLPTPVRFRSPDDSAHLILNPEVVADSARYGVRIRDADGGIIWRSEALELQASGVFHLSLPARAFPPGRYSLELYGIKEDRETLLGIYRIAIEK
jgi:hypothetical protein